MIGKAKGEGNFRTMKHCFGGFFPSSLLSFLFSLTSSSSSGKKEKGVKFVTSELFLSPPPHVRCDGINDGKFMELHSLQIV